MRMGPSGAYLEFHVPDSITVPLVFVRTVLCVCRTGCNGGGGGVVDAATAVDAAAMDAAAEMKQRWRTQQ